MPISRRGKGRRQSGECSPLTLLSTAPAGCSTLRRTDVHCLRIATRHRAGQSKEPQPMLKYVEAGLAEAHQALERLRADRTMLETIARAGELLVSTFEARGRVFSCGNGGSMCDAMHFAEELTGRYRRDRPALAATAISDPGHLSCVGNDYGYDQVFSRYVQAHGRVGDCLVAISTSGKSPNILKAATAAKAGGMTVIGLCGQRRPEFDAVCDIVICTPGGSFADRVQELHIKVLHILIELVERRLCPANYE